MRELFQSQLADLTEQLVQMAEASAKAISDASEALLRPDLSTAESVIAADVEIDAMQSHLDELSVTLLARQAPVASDLRMVVSALRLSSTLERMGDLSCHVAKLVRLRFPDPVVPASLHGEVSDMAEHAQRLSLKAVRILETRELAIHEEMIKEDDGLDRLHRAMFDRLPELKSELSPETTIDVTLLSRYLERYGDHAVSVARRVEFMVNGQGRNALTEWQDAQADDF